MNLPAAETAGYPKNNTKNFVIPRLGGCVAIMEVPIMSF